MTTTNADMRDRIRKAIRNQKRPTVTVLSSLLAVEDELHYIPEEAIEEVAEFNDTTINEVWGVASFYTNFRFSPPGERVVEICWGPTCHLVGAQGILNAVLGALGLRDEGETEDNKISLKYNTCLGACSNAPVISIDHRLMGRQNVESTLKLMSELRESRQRRARH